jgi:hypothetical protein
MNRHLRRLEKLEAATHDKSITCTVDGVQFRLRRDDVLPLTCQAFRRRHSEIEGEPIPVSRFDQRLDHLARATVVSSAEPLLEIAVDCLRRNDE